MINVLWVTPKWPLPAHDGARLATTALLRSLKDKGFNIDLVAIAAPEEGCILAEAKETLYLRHIFVIRRSSARFAFTRYFNLLFSFLLNPSLPLTMQSYASRRTSKAMALVLGMNTEDSKLEKLMEEKASLSRWDFIVYDGLHASAHSSKKGKYFRPPACTSRLVYRAHNHETRLWERKEALSSNFISRLFYKNQARKVAAYENSLLASTSVLAGVSAEDLLSFEKSCPALRQNPRLRSALVPIGLNFESPLQFNDLSTDINLGFLGRLDWPPNREGLIWFLEKIWPTCVEKHPFLKLCIAGCGNAEYISSLSLPNLRFLGEIEDTIAFYESADLCIVPVFYGSGTRVKILEAASFGRACLSTGIGAEGCTLRAGHSYIRADNQEEWIECIQNLNRKSIRQMGNEAFNDARIVFDIDKCGQDFSELLKGTAEVPNQNENLYRIENA